MAQFREYTVDLMEEKPVKGFVMRTLVVINEKVNLYTKHRSNLIIVPPVQQTTSAHQVVQLHMTNWSPDGSCSHLATITSVMNEMSAIQRRTGNHPIIVHCRCVGYCVPIEYTHCIDLFSDLGVMYIRSGNHLDKAKSLCI